MIKYDLIYRWSYWFAIECK